MNAPAEPSPPLTPADPRLSEWIDGRLSPAEAAAVERAVSRSPELARLVADLRGMKAAVRQVTAASPPAGFADRVMAAVAAARGDAAPDPSDRLVAAEWRAIEAERIAEERAEAAADLEEKIPVRPAKRPTWPWLTIATALAAGLLVTVVLNVPRLEPGAVEVAVLTDRAAEPRIRSRALSEAAEDKAAGEFGGGKEADASAGAAPAADATLSAVPADPAAAGEALAETGPEAEQLAAADKLADAIEIMVRGPEGRAKLRARLASLGLTAMPSGPEVLELVGPEEAVAAFLAAPTAGVPTEPLAAARGQSLPNREGDTALAARAVRAEASADAEAAASRALTAPPAAALHPAAGQAAARRAGVALPTRRILIRVIELPAAAGEPSEP